MGKASDFLNLHKKRRSHLRAVPSNPVLSPTQLQRERDLQAVMEGALAKSGDIQELLLGIVGQLKEVFNADTVSVLTFNPSHDRLILRASVGLETQLCQGILLPLHEGVYGKILTSEKPLQFDNLSRESVLGQSLEQLQLKSLLGTSLRVGKRPIGVMHIGLIDARAFRNEEVQLLQLMGERVAVAIENAKLISERTIRNRFVSILSHDIRNPLSVSKISAELLLRQSEKPEVVKDLSRRIIFSLLQSDELIQDLLDINKILAGQTLPLSLKWFDLCTVAAQIIQTLKVAHGDHFMLECPAQIMGHWSERIIKRMIELSTRAGFKYGASGPSILLKLSSPVEEKIRLSVRFSGKLEDPGDFTESTSNFQHWSLDWALIRGFAQAQGGNVFISSDGHQTDLSIELPVL